MLRVKAGEAADTIFTVFGLTQPKIKLSLPCFFSSQQLKSISIKLRSKNVKHATTKTQKHKQSSCC